MGKSAKRDDKKKTNTRTSNKGNQNQNKESKSKKKGFWKRHTKLAKFLKILIAIILLLFIVGVGIIVAIFNSDQWNMTEKDLTYDNINTTIYDADGNEIANLAGAERRKVVPLSEIPKHLQDAYISIEDERFEQHHGVDIKRTLAVTVKYILHRGSSSSGGGSTITQQTVKNFMNDKDDSGLGGIKRKVREMSRAIKLEKQLSKSQILELYLNLIFVGGPGIHGVELGSQYYFNKSVKDLDLAECAFLAGINNAPNSYNPFEEKDNSELIKKRTKTVLAKMKELGKITEEEYNSAKEEVEAGLKFEQGTTTTNVSMSYLARAAFNQVVKDYAQEKEIDEKTAASLIEGKGYKIYTTQNSSIQANLEEVYRSGDYVYPGNKKDSDGNLINEHTQSAMVVVDHKTGYVVGCMGGLGDDVDSNGLNRATQSTRQPGSAMKPIAAIAPSLEAGIINAATIYDESSTNFGNYHPTNSGKGLITVRKAIEISANTTECKIMSELGPKNSIEFLRKMGISTLVTADENSEHNDENLPMVLGGLTIGISPLEMAGAYATIANDGVYITPTFYTKVEDSSGNVILEAKQEKTRVMSEANAFIEKSILTGPVIGSNGTASRCKIPNQETAGKTGSTNSYVDRWFCGFTSYYTAATWYGYDKDQEPLKGEANYTNRSCQLWAAAMKKIHAGLPESSFTKPSDVVTAKVCLQSGKVATSACSQTYTEYFVKGTIPVDCEGHTKLTICKETGKIATEHCPDTEEKTYAKRPEKEDTTLWRTNDGGKYDVPTETCDVHTTKVIKMPNVIGKTKDEASKILKDLGLKVTVETKSSQKNDGEVIEQSKAEGTTLKAGDSVTITVSKKANSGDSKNEIHGNEIDNPTPGKSER